MKLWNLVVPHKVRVFLWRLCKNNIPVRSLLRSRGVQTTILCPMCGQDVEHPLHIFLDCQFAAGCWRFFGREFDASVVEDCPQWVLQLLSTDLAEVAVQKATILWRIWSARNLKVWEGKSMLPDMAMQWSVNQITQWSDAQSRKRVKVNVRARQHNNREYWKPPEEGHYKINVDAAVQPRAIDFAVGMVLRNHQGTFSELK